MTPPVDLSSKAGGVNDEDEGKPALTMEKDNSNRLLKFLKLRLQVQAWAKVGFTVVRLQNTIPPGIIVYELLKYLPYKLLQSHVCPPLPGAVPSVRRGQTKNQARLTQEGGKKTVINFKS